MERRTGYADLGDQRIAYEVVGDGPVDFVLNTGWLSPFDAEWDDPHSRAFFEQFGRFARLIRFDRRGVGASDPIPSDGLPPWESLSDEYEAVMDAAQSAQAVVLGGGTAGPATAFFAATRPERTAGMVLFQATVRLLADEDYPFGISEAERDQMLELLGREWGTGRFTATLFPSRASDLTFIEYMAKQERATATPTLIRKYIAADMNSDGRAVLPMITVPVLVVHRTDSPALPIEHGRYIVEHTANARLVEVPGGDIAPFFEYPELTLAAFEEFASTIHKVAVPDRQLATVLFTDIVDSTRKAEELGDRRWQTLLERHHEIAKQAVADHLGIWIRSTGDGIVAKFPGPGRAIASATHLLRQLADIDLHIRTGIHSGEVEIRGSNVGGIAVHLAARVMEEARADEILVSRTVKDLVVGSDLTFEDRGTHALKGIDDPWQLYAVVLI